MAHWSSIPWQQFDAAQVDSRLLALVKGACLVEANAADYVQYLKNVFSDFPEMHADFEAWGEEEKRHGEALRAWAERADPEFDYNRALQVFTAAYRVPIQNQESVRGSRGLELVARCVVETGTSSFYTAIRDASREPVLREICRRIAGDEIRHYNLFLNQLNTVFAKHEHLNRWQRLKTILSRSLEVSDQELCFAYFAANETENFDARRADHYSRFYMSEVSRLYRPQHFKLTAQMLGKAVGWKVRPWVSQPIGVVAHKAMVWRYAQSKISFRSSCCE